MVSVSRALAGACAIVWSASCGPQPPKLAAAGSGDLSNALVDRPHAEHGLNEACNEGRDPGISPLLVRAPYVQSVTESSARVLFWMRSEATPPEVVLRQAGSGAAQRAIPAVAAGIATPPGVVQLEARFDGLAAGTLHCYAVDGLGDPVAFRTAPAAATAGAARFVALGDSGTGSVYQHAVAAALQTVPYEFVLHLGDVAYESGSRPELQKYFFGVYGRLARSFAVFPIAGNHDYRTEAAAPLLEAFSLPDNAPAGRSERFYSSDWGGAHLVGLDTESLDQIQLDWLERDLAAHAGRWLIVFGHRPLYSSGESGGDARLRGLLEPIFQRHGVHLVLSGHEHDYERTRPLGGVTYVVSGGGGRGTRPVSQSAFTAYSEDVLHFLFVEATPEALIVHAIDGTGREFDGARIER
jgi:hypothetical protein